MSSSGFTLDDGSGGIQVTVGKQPQALHEQAAQLAPGAYLLVIGKVLLKKNGATKHVKLHKVIRRAAGAL